MTNSTRSSIGAQVSDAAGAAFDATFQALDSGKQFATDAAGRIGDTARDLRASAADLTRTGAQSVSSAAGAAQRKLGHYANSTRRYIGDEPLMAALISAAVGAAAAMLLMAFMGRRRDRE
jgi:ElaB/YqjD/DUF883 family membrane-anchored ribosome-binding protein